MTDFDTIRTILEAYEPADGSKLSAATVIRLGNHIVAKLSWIEKIHTAIEAAYNDMNRAEEKLGAAQSMCEHPVVKPGDDGVARCDHCDLRIITITAPQEKLNA